MQSVQLLESAHRGMLAWPRCCQGVQVELCMETSRAARLQVLIGIHGSVFITLLKPQPLTLVSETELSGARQMGSNPRGCAGESAATAFCIS